MTAAAGAEPGPPGRAFDELAGRYDTRFTDTLLGQALRQAVWQVCERTFAPGARVLDLGAGTGADALHLAGRGHRVHALDASLRMARATRAKLLAAGLAQQVTVEARRIEDVGDLARGCPFDGALSNFGALNCVPALSLAAAGLAGVLRPRAPVVAVVMGPLCAWELAWFAAQGQPVAATRRWRRSGSLARVAGRSFRVYYPSPQTLERAFRPWFTVERCRGLGVALPSSDAAAWVTARPRLARWLLRLEPAVADRPGAAWLADHYLMVLRRRGEER